MNGSKEIQKASSPRLRQAFLKLFKFLFGFASMLLICGFGAFLLHIARARPVSPLPRVDGIVVVTGKGGGRLSAGAQLLKDGAGERLLISGVNPALKTEQMQTLLNLSKNLYECCVDLDYEAEDTFENGQQTANWARALGYETIILVTSDYHMPRAKIEISTAMHGIQIIPFPVKAMKPEDAPWWGGVKTWRRLFGEYGKLLVSFAREPGVRPNRKPDLTDASLDENPYNEIPIDGPEK